MKACFFFCLIFFTRVLHGAELHGPIFQWWQDPSTTVAIHWVSDEKSAEAFSLHYYPKKNPTLIKEGKITQHSFGPTEKHVFRANITALRPNTLYQFELKHAGKLVEKYRLVTAPRVFERPMRFVVGGDMFHERKWLDAMNARAGKEAPLFALLGGDLAYGNGQEPARWYEWLESWEKKAVTPRGRTIPMVVAIGNHEIFGDQGIVNPRTAAPYFYSLFSLPDGRSNYCLDFGNYLSLLLLDSGHTQTVSAQTTWLARSFGNRKKIPYVFACYHRPTYGTLVKDDYIPIRTEWTPIFDQFSPTAVFENDHHVYKRTKPLYKGQVDKEKGTVYLGDGAWGVDVRKINSNGKKLPYLAKTASKRHLITVDLNFKKAYIRALTASGNEIDSTTLTPRKYKKVAE